MSNGTVLLEPSNNPPDRLASLAMRHASWKVAFVGTHWQAFFFVFSASILYITVFISIVRIIIIMV